MLRRGAALTSPQSLTSSPPPFSSRDAHIARRLEAATSRLEDIAESTQGSPAATSSSPPSTGPPAAVSKSLPPATPSNPAPPAPPVEPLPEVVEEYDQFIKNSVLKYVEIAKGVDKHVAEQVRLRHQSPTSDTPTLPLTCRVPIRLRYFSTAFTPRGTSSSSRPRQRSLT